MNAPRRNIEGIARMCFKAIQMCRQRTIGEHVFEVCIVHISAKPVHNRSSGSSFYYEPHFALSVGHTLGTGHFIIGVHLYAKVATGINNFYQQRKLGAITLHVIFTHKSGAIFSDKLRNVQTHIVALALGGGFASQG